MELTSPFPREAWREAYKWHQATTTCLNGRNHTEQEFLVFMHMVHQRPGVRSWGISHMGELVGLVLFDPIYRAGKLCDGTIHICLARRVWGMGLIESAARVILPELFLGIPSLLRLSAYTPSHYRPGLRCATALGFTECGRLTDAVEIDGVIRDITVTGLTRRAWMERVAVATTEA